MSYSLGENHIDGQLIEIDRQRYDSIIQAKNIISAWLDIERLYALCANSYFEFEKLILVAGLEYSVGMFSYDQMEAYFEEFHSRLNIRVVTFLNSYKAYCDQSQRHSTALEVGFPGISERVQIEFSKSFDSCFEWRVCNALRNHAQHHNLPVDGSSFGSRLQQEEDNLESGKPSRWRISSNPYFKVSSLTQNKNLRSKTRAELSDMQFDKIDIKMLLRGFIAELAKCHANLREAFSPHFDEAAAEITEVYACVSRAKGCDAKHVSVFNETNADDPISTYLRLSNIEQCSAYRVRWRGLQTAQKRFVSSEPVQQDDTFFQTGGDIWISK